MAVIDRSPAASARPALPDRGALRARQLLPHVVLLAVVVAAIGWLLGPGIFTIDENAYRTQAERLIEAGEWGVPLVDNGSTSTVVYPPLALSQVSGDVFYPYARHPAYPLAVVAADPIAPGAGGLLLSGAALVVLAVGAALATDRLSGVDGRVGFWVAACASPLLVHAHIEWAHLPAAAAFVVAVVVIQRCERWRLLPAVGVALGVAGAVLFRTEGVIASVALVVALAATHRPLADSIRWIATVSSALIVSFVLDRLAFQWVTGEVAIAPTGGTRTGDPFAVQRLQAAIALFLDVGGSTPQHVARLMAALLLIGAAVLVRRRADRGIVVILSGLAVVAGLAGALQDGSYPGLLAAWPLLVPALVLVGSAVEHRLALVTIGLTWVGLVAIGPADGGGLGWGGRLGVVVLGLAVPIVAAAIARPPVDGARIVTAAGAVLTVAVSLAGLATLETARETSVVVEADVSRALDEFVDTTDVLISTDRRLGRIAPHAASRVPLQSMADDAPLAAFFDAAVRAETDRVVHLDLFDHDLPTTPAGWRASEPTIDGLVRTIVFEREAP